MKFSVDLGTGVKASEDELKTSSETLNYLMQQDTVATLSTLMVSMGSATIGNHHRNLKCPFLTVATFPTNCQRFVANLYLYKGANDIGDGSRYDTSELKDNSCIPLDHWPPYLGNNVVGWPIIKIKKSQDKQDVASVEKSNLLTFKELQSFDPSLTPYHYFELFDISVDDVPVSSRIPISYLQIYYGTPNIKDDSIWDTSRLKGPEEFITVQKWPPITPPRHSKNKLSQSIDKVSVVNEEEHTTETNTESVTNEMQRNTESVTTAVQTKLILFIGAWHQNHAEREAAIQAYVEANGGLSQSICAKMGACVQNILQKLQFYPFIVIPTKTAIIVKSGIAMRCLAPEVLSSVNIVVQIPSANYPKLQKNVLMLGEEKSEERQKLTQLFEQQDKTYVLLNSFEKSVCFDILERMDEIYMFQSPQTSDHELMLHLCEKNKKLKQQKKDLKQQQKTLKQRIEFLLFGYYPCIGKYHEKWYCKYYLI